MLSSTLPPRLGLDPRFKVGMLLLTGVFAVILDNPASLAILASVAMLCAIMTRPTRRQLLFLSTILGLTVWALLVSQAIFYSYIPRTPIFEIISPETPLLGTLTGGVAIYYEGIYHGMVQSLRLVSTLGVGLATAWTTDPSHLLASFSALRFPHALAFGAATAARFLPVTIEEAQIALRAQQIRGLRLRGRFGLNAIRALFSIARPVLAASIRRAEMVALSAASRGYNPNVRRTSMTRLQMSWSEKAVLLWAGLAAVFVTTCKVLYLLYASGIYYHPGFRSIYSITREIL